MLFKNGHIPWNKGVKNCFSKETLEKMSKNNIGRIPYNKGMINKISIKCDNCGKEKMIVKNVFKRDKHNFCNKICNLNYIKSYGTWNKNTKGIMKPNSTSFKNTHIPWNKGLKGIHLHLETEFKKGNIPHNKGKRLSNKTIMKIKEKRALQKIPLMDTKIEKRMQKLLIDNNIEFIPHKLISDIKHKYRCDLFVPEGNIIIECDGNYWHNYPIGRPLDIQRNIELSNKGYVVLRFWEHEINSITKNELGAKLKWV